MPQVVPALARPAVELVCSSPTILLTALIAALISFITLNRRTTGNRSNTLLPLQSCIMDLLEVDPGKFPHIPDSLQLTPTSVLYI